MEDEAFATELTQLACTQQQTRSCQLLLHLTACNDILGSAGLQLREDPCDEPGLLSIVPVPGICPGFPYCPSCTNIETKALDLLKWLLIRHHCVVSLEANYGVVNKSGQAEAVAASSSLKRLTIFGRAVDPPDLAKQGANPHGSFRFMHDYENSTAALQVPILLLLKRDSTLVKLDLARLLMGPSTARKLFDALLGNITVEELALEAGVFATDTLAASFESLLVNRNATLKKLTLRGLYDGNISRWQELAEAICRVTTLENLTLQGLATFENSALFLETVARSRSLRCLTFLVGSITYVVPNPPPRSANLGVPPWLSALQESGTLQKLDIDASWFSVSEYFHLRKAISVNNRLQSVTLHSLAGSKEMHEVRRAIQECGHDRRVRIVGYAIVPEEECILPVCQHVTSILVCDHRYTRKLAALRDVFGIIATWSHVTCICVILDSFDEHTFSYLAVYIRDSKTIKEIDLIINTSPFQYRWVHDALFRSVSNLCEALSSSTSVTSIELTCSLELRDEDYQALADAPKKNRQLHKLAVCGIFKAPLQLFFNELHAGLQNNYNLLLLEVPMCGEVNDDMRAVQDIVRRNCSVIDRASRFVLGSHVREFACAFEIVSEEPVLRMKVGEKVSPNEEAESMVRSAQQLLRNADLHAYMELAGVVKDCVQCSRRDDGRLQLDQLPYECWWNIRQYLKIADIVEP